MLSEWLRGIAMFLFAGLVLGVSKRRGLRATYSILYPAGSQPLLAGRRSSASDRAYLRQHANSSAEALVERCAWCGFMGNLAGGACLCTLPSLDV